MEYVVNKGRIALHSTELKLYYEGETINVSHLSSDALADCLADGVIIEKDKYPTEEVENG